MDRYHRVEKPREEAPIKENEIRITTQGRMRNYITYATALLQDKGSDEVVFKAMGRAINKTVMIAELIKRRIVGLHQNTTTGSTDITDMWEPLEEGLLPLETTRHVSMITITLSKKELDKSSVGYQSPLPADEVKPLVEYDNDEAASSPAGRGRGRGGRGRGWGRGRGNGYNDYADGSWENDHAPPYMGNGYARGRGRGFRGRGRRGGYGGQSDYHQDGGYYDEAHVPAPARGRGRGGGRGRGPARGRGRGGNANGVMHAVAAGA
ncbi:H/ACA ribonucleoprotein complex subunit GAR1-like isoform X2 [Phragmites australis]|uniref:H/ACA ribonucleoprotein complex subunit GAR1-like isoform X2 n=1 Tax=Phragmites australis TaxID=29695 RepID=UPI002D77C694|nr:H/ACA ribonucleoprotein complex subunit GAR1-like isoform X2 [Phragmites australis]